MGLQEKFKKIYKEEQPIKDIEFIYKNKTIMGCYEHFNERLDKRLGYNLQCYTNYVNTWVKFLRGKLSFISGDKMIRYIGNYLKDEQVYKVIYIKKCGIFVPLTIYEIDDHHMKFRLHMRMLNTKKKMKKDE